jgi:opacity protein-like surface antigen
MNKGFTVFLFAGILLIASAAPGDEPRQTVVEKAGPVSDGLLTVGFSTNERAGLHPRHESDTEYGLRIDGRFFLGALVDNPILKGIGVGGYYNTVFDLKYGIPGGDDWDASQHQWNVEVLYRLAMNEVILQPTILFRVGYGSTSCIIDTEHTLALSVSYGYPYAAMEFYLMLIEPFVRLHASAGYLFAVSLGEDLSGSGSGLDIRVGVDVNLFEHIHVGMGFEWLRFYIDDEQTGETMDMYDSMFFRIGWNYH